MNTSPPNWWAFLGIIHYMEKREWHYILPPQAFDMTCKCGSRNLEWSEYEDHIWCYDCEIDYNPKDTEHAGIFSGPIPLQASAMFGTSFDRFWLEERKIQRFNITNGEWDDDWFVHTPDKVAKALLLDELDDLDDRYGDVSYMKAKQMFSSEAMEYYREMLCEILSRFRDEHPREG